MSDKPQSDDARRDRSHDENVLRPLADHDRLGDNPDARGLDADSPSPDLDTKTKHPDRPDTLDADVNSVGG